MFEYIDSRNKECGKHMLEVGDTMKLLHIASHKGNIGDIVNHEGFYHSICGSLKEITIEKIELRDFYFSAQNRKHFDVKFANHMNNFDLVVFGGGGFFDVRWEKSNTGTSLDFSDDFMDAVSTKVLVNAMGYHEYPGITNKSITSKYERFLNVAIARHWMLTVRNDGSYSRICRRYRKELAEQILVVPDNGFFVPCETKEHKEVPSSPPVVGMCITNDLFSEAFNRGVREEAFNAYMAKNIEKLCSMGITVKLFPHTPADIGTISTLLSMIPNEYKRTQITVASYDASSPDAVSWLLSAYRECDCIIGMRFHSLVSGVRLGIPTIALAGHEQIQALFHELALDEYCIKVDNLSFANQLLSYVENSLSNSEIIKKQYKVLYRNLEQQEENYRATFCKFLSQ